MNNRLLAAFAGGMVILNAVTLTASMQKPHAPVAMRLAQIRDGDEYCQLLQIGGQSNKLDIADFLEDAKKTVEDFGCVDLEIVEER